MKIKDRVLRFTRNQLCVFHRVIFIYKVLSLQDYYILYIYIYIYIYNKSYSEEYTSAPLISQNDPEKACPN